jgi:ligand-binding SRPBCC domain-containing protein
VEYLLERRQLIPRRVSELFEFFEDPRNLAKITPKGMNFRITEMDEPPIRPGFSIKYEIKWLGIGLSWTTAITEYQPGRKFLDVQTKGPYALWEHEHTFKEINGQTLMKDRVRYALPFGILGSIVHRLIVRRQLEHIFDYRAKRIRKMYAARPQVPAEAV